MAHLDGYKFLSDRQHVFWKRHSCETLLTTEINNWLKSWTMEDKLIHFIFDFEKAFDTPQHKLFKSYCIGRKPLNWIDSFLYYRQQRVVVKGAKSSWALGFFSGVP